MDYREKVKKYGSPINIALTDQEYIDWLIKVLQAEGFGDAKTTFLLDGNEIDTVKTAEDSTSITSRIDRVAINDVGITYSVDEGINQEWGKTIASDGLNIDITITRKTYALEEVDFTDLEASDQNRSAIDDAGVNDNLLVDYEWEFANVGNTNELTNGDTLVGTVVTTDERGREVTKSITINRQNRYIWGILRGTDTAANIATALASVPGDIVSGDDDATFLELTTGLGSLPSSLDIDSLGENRTFFIASMDAGLQFFLDSGFEFPITPVSASVNLNSISSGDANLSRTYNMYVVDLNTNFTLTVQ